VPIILSPKPSGFLEFSFAPLKKVLAGFCLEKNVASGYLQDYLKPALALIAV
jgi:hypothetical protein